MQTYKIYISLYKNHLLMQKMYTINDIKKKHANIQKFILKNIYR